MGLLQEVHLRVSTVLKKHHWQLLKFARTVKNLLHFTTLLGGW